MDFPARSLSIGTPILPLEPGFLLEPSRSVVPLLGFGLLSAPADEQQRRERQTRRSEPSVTAKPSERGRVWPVHVTSEQGHRHLYVVILSILKIIFLWWLSNAGDLGGNVKFHYKMIHFNK